MKKKTAKSLQLPPSAVAKYASRPKDHDRALFYDVRFHGKIDFGDMILLFRDGSFKKAVKRCRQEKKTY